MEDTKPASAQAPAPKLLVRQVTELLKAHDVETSVHKDEPLFVLAVSAEREYPGRLYPSYFYACAPDGMTMGLLEEMQRMLDSMKASITTVLDQNRAIMPGTPVCGDCGRQDCPGAHSATAVITPDPGEVNSPSVISPVNTPPQKTEPTPLSEQERNELFSRIMSNLI